ncbi:MAG: multidrug DMT transporter permease [Betaproteobacteria bacterium RBG_16_64_9]|nr:MAG: multidrug DMT transporter permease [Betaproteobacteria bacterium RBG_16_64_9]OGA20900.1 MAG: multidrug DMT transporter permease [Betaproteobacteria bacterium RIFCSPLOWO2_02_FULL_65_24]OGA75941.1 MAG: multidrug DMT transporter permease [Betaproteobacteria bacterium RIFCSPLOWO2_12_FULL_66_14]
MVLLTFVWGFTFIVTKLAANDVTLVMQSGIRSIIAVAFLLGWARWRGIPVFGRDKTWWPGLAVGALFGGEFLFIYAGLEHTGASRMVVFVYLAPVLTAIGVHLFVPGERLHPAQWLGVVAAFLGIVVAFGEGFVAAPAVLLGDAFGIIGAFFWAATTVAIRATRLSHATASKVLFYQLAVSAVMLPLASLAMGEAGVVRVSAVAIASLAYQGVLVSFATYLVWFWLLTRYLAGRLSVFSFLTPLFGVIGGVLVLNEPLRPAFVFAVVLVGYGIFLVNRPSPGNIRSTE